MLGHLTAPLTGAHVAAESAVRGLVRVLQPETGTAPGIRIPIVEPGAVGTSVYTPAANNAGHIGRPPPPGNVFEPSERVAERADA